eukprot:1177230-Prorocentrum_minimum.AAC.1
MTRRLHERGRGGAPAAVPPGRARAPPAARRPSAVPPPPSLAPLGRLSRPPGRETGTGSGGVRGGGALFLEREARRAEDIRARARHDRTPPVKAPREDIELIFPAVKGLNNEGFVPECLRLPRGEVRLKRFDRLAERGRAPLGLLELRGEAAFHVRRCSLHPLQRRLLLADQRPELRHHHPL